MCQKRRNKHKCAQRGRRTKQTATQLYNGSTCHGPDPASVLPEQLCSCLTELRVNILCSVPHRDSHRRDITHSGRIRTVCANYVKCDKSVIRHRSSCPEPGRFWPTSLHCSEAASKITCLVRGTDGAPGFSPSPWGFSHPHLAHHLLTEPITHFTGLTSRMQNSSDDTVKMQIFGSD